MPFFRSCTIAILGLALGLAMACGKSPGVPGDSSTSATNSPAAPFAHESRSGSDPSLEPLVTTPGSLPEGTPIAIRLMSPISSASSHAGDTFEGILDDPILIEDQTDIPRGAAVAGRVLAAKASEGRRDPGYLRIALVSITIDGKRVASETSSLFIKANLHGKHGRPATAAATNKNDVAFDAGHRVVFRLAQTVELR